MIRDNSIGNPFIDSIRNTSNTRKGFSGFSNITTGRIRNVTSAEYHGHLTGTYMVALNDTGTDQLIPCKLLKASASMDGVGEYIPCEEGDPVTVLFKDGRMDIGYILGGIHTEGKYRDFLIDGKGQDPFSLIDMGSKEGEINQPSIHPDRIATPDALFSIVGSRELGKDPYADVALSDPFNLQEVASQRPQPGSIFLRNKQGDVGQYAKGDIVLYADGDIILFSNKTKDAECTKLRIRVQYYKDLIKKLESKFKGNSTNFLTTQTFNTTSNNTSSKTNLNNVDTSLKDSFVVNATTQKLSTTKIDGLVDLLTSKNITKFPNNNTTKYSITNKNVGFNNTITKPTLSETDHLKNAEKLKEYALNLLINSEDTSQVKQVTQVIEQANKELNQIDTSLLAYAQVPRLKRELETISKQINIDLNKEAPYSSEFSSNNEINSSSSSNLNSNTLPSDHPKNREKYSVDTILNADYLEPYILRYHIDQLNKLITITTSEIETCLRDLAAVKTSSNNTTNNNVSTSSTLNESTTNYNPRKAKCGKTLVETIKDLPDILGKTYGSGTCYEGVADAIEYAGLGKLGGDCQINGPNGLFNQMSGYTAWAVDFAKFFNEDASRLKKFEIRNLKAEGIVDPNDPRVPPGAVIVVGQNEYVNRIEGDINIKTDDGQYLNPRSMTSFMSLSEYWKANPDKVHGIFIDALSYSIDVPKPSSTTTPLPTNIPATSTNISTASPKSGAQQYAQRIAALSNNQLYTTSSNNYEDAWKKEPYKNKSYTEWTNLLSQEANLFRDIDTSKTKNILLGDSLSHWFPPSKLPTNAIWLNQGISGDKTFQTINRLDPLKNQQADNIYIMLGTNDIRYGSTDEEILNNIKTLIQKVKSLNVASNVIVQSILPTRLDNMPTSRIRNLNTQIQSIAQQQGIKYLDVFSSMLNENDVLKKNYSTDGIHLTPEGYQAWAQLL